MHKAPQKRSRLAQLFFIVALLTSIVACGKQPEYTINQPSRAETQPAPNSSVFDGARAFAHVKSLTEIGPRPAGSEGIKRAQEYISKELKSYGLKVTEDKFVADTPKGNVPMLNIVAELPGDKKDIVILATHYDTKLLPGFVGANDGGSSTGAVLELARVLAPSKPEYTLWFVFFDGEEAFIDWNARNGTDNTYGSRHMVSKLSSGGNLSTVKALILLDMVGDRDLDFMRDLQSTPWLVDVIWSAARRIGHGSYFLGNDSAYEDDHIPFIKAGIPAVDLIDFNFGPNNSYWHELDDTLDKVRPESIRVTGDVVLAALPDVYKKLNEPSRSRQTNRNP